MSDPVTYSAVLSVSKEIVLFVSGLLAAERRRRGTRSRRRALGCYRQAVLVLRYRDLSAEVTGRSEVESG